MMLPQSSQKEEQVYRHNTDRYLKFGAKTPTLHFEAQRMYTTTSSAIADRQSLVTALLYYKLSLHLNPVKSTLR